MKGQSSVDRSNGGCQKVSNTVLVVDIAHRNAKMDADVLLSTGANRGKRQSEAGG